MNCLKLTDGSLIPVANIVNVTDDGISKITFRLVDGYLQDYNVPITDFITTRRQIDNAIATPEALIGGLFFIVPTPSFLVEWSLNGVTWSSANVTNSTDVYIRVTVSYFNVSTVTSADFDFTYGGGVHNVAYTPNLLTPITTQLGPTPGIITMPAAGNVMYITLYDENITVITIIQNALTVV